MWNMFFENSVMFPAFFQFLLRLDKSLPDVKIQFILNPLAIPEVLDILDLHGQPLHDHIMYLTRTYAYYIYRQKQILLGHWKSDSILAKKNKNYHINSIDTSTNISLITGLSRTDPTVLSLPPAGLPLLRSYPTLYDTHYQESRIMLATTQSHGHWCCKMLGPCLMEYLVPGAAIGDRNATAIKI